MLLENSINGQSAFKTTKTATEVLQVIEALPAETIIFIDIDDTVITPASKTFRLSPYNKLIDDLKQNKDQYPNYEQILSNWRLQRKAMLLDSNWPIVLNVLKEKFQVYGLTKMDTGTFGNIQSMEQWRYQELKSLGIEFSFNQNLETQAKKFQWPNAPAFYRGIFITGSASKSATLEQYKANLLKPNLVMIDDRPEHLRDLEAFCAQNFLGFTGILFDGMSILAQSPNPSVVALQKQYLVQHAVWLEDEEAEAYVNQGFE